MHIPRWYQGEAVDSFFNFLEMTATEPERAPIIAMPTGTGKSFVISLIFDRLLRRYPMMKVMMLTHVATLIEQNAEKMLSVWPGAPLGIFSASLGRKELGMPMIYGGVQSVKNVLNDDMPIPNVVLVDEAQLVSDDEQSAYGKIFDFLRKKNKHVRIGGLSATPYRVGKGMLTDPGGIFTDMCYDITGMHAFNRLLDEGYMSPLIPFPTSTVLDVSGVGKSKGDYNKGELEAAVDVESITRAAIIEALSMAHDRNHWLIFASGVKHAESIARMLRMYGQAAEAVHSKMPANDVINRIAAFRSGRLRMLVNANMLTTGFDYPEIDCIVMLRPTTSTGLWVQMLGRGTRPVYAPGYDLEVLEQRLFAMQMGGKLNCLVLDFAGNISNLGPINDPMIPKKRSGKVGDAPVKICEKGKVKQFNENGLMMTPCGAWNHASVRHCGNCGCEFIFQPKIVEVASTKALIVRDEPIIETFNVNHVTYQVWTKRNAPPSIQVQYHCGVLSFFEWVCLEHEGYPSKVARDWWRVRFNLKKDAETPPTTEEAHKWIHLARTPVQIKVHINRKNPLVMDHIFKEQLQYA